MLFCQFDKQPNFLHFFQTQTLSFSGKLLLILDFPENICNIDAIINMLETKI